MKNPSRHDRVKHQQHIVSGDGKVSHDMPFRAFWLQGPVGRKNTFSRGSPHGVLHGHDRYAQNHQKQQINQHKQAASALSHHIRKAPHIADADGAARRKQNKAQTAPQFLSLTHNSPVSICRTCRLNPSLFSPVSSYFSPVFRSFLSRICPHQEQSARYTPDRPCAHRRRGSGVLPSGQCQNS